MQASNFFYYPCSPYYLFQQYAPMFPYFQPLQDYNSCLQNCRLTELQPVENITAAVDTSQNLPNTSNPLPKPQMRPRKNKIPTLNSGFFKEKAQKFSDKNTKNLNPRIVEQKEGRNANSNLLRMFFRRLQNKIQDNPHHIQYVIKKYQMQISVEEFIEWVQTNKIDHRNYIRVPTIRKLFVEQKFVRQHTKIMRILFKDFIDSESINCYLTSKKVRRHMMTHNYDSIRNIFQDVLAIKA